MGNNQPSARKKTYYISLAILAGMFLYSDSYHGSIPY